SPLFDVVVVLQNARTTESGFTTFERPAKTAKYDLNFTFEENGHAFLEFNTDLFDADRAQRLVAQFQTCLAACLADRSQIIVDVDILPEDERRLVVETFNDTDADYPRDATLVDLFEASAAKHADRVAIVCGDRTLTYRELDARANAYATTLDCRDGLVPVLAERSEETIVRFLGILKAGGAYVPIDPTFPAERAQLIESETRGAKQRGAAYVIYTSGSTGTPKGCVVTHRNVVRLMTNSRFPFDFDERDVWIVAHSFAFDFSVWEMYGALLYGGKLVLPTRDEVRNPATLRALLKQHRVTVLNQTPAAFQSLIEIERDEKTHDLDDHLRVVIFGGDRLEPAMLRPWLQHYERIQLVNMYGITETTVHVTYGPLTRDQILGDPGSPIGVPLPETRVYVLDPRMHPRPIGVPGELYVGGSGVCDGYLNREELTAQRFVANPFRENERVYRSGDVGLWTADGTLQHLGRNDHQVQLRGFRIELGEIEHVLLTHPRVQRAVVRKQEDRLIAWIEGDASADELRALARTKLPDYMVPARFVGVEKVPLTANGKIDSAALRAPIAGAETLLDIWRSVLRRDDIGIDDNFFEVGGHSLLLVDAHRKMRERGIDVPLVDLFRYPTIRALATTATPQTTAHRQPATANSDDVAIIGISARLPNAPDVATFWRNLRDGVESSVTLTDEQLRAAGVPRELARDPRYVRTKPFLADIDLFDAAHFGIGPREADVMDPQHRLFLECAWEALESAGEIDCAGARVGVFAGASLNSYVLHNLLPNRALLDSLGIYPVLIGNDRDFVATRVSYKLDLRGPSLNVSTACSTSLVAVHLACRSLLDGQCDMAIAGAASVKVPQTEGYVYDEGGIMSPDGRCRAFDARANGTVGGSGVGVVILKRLDDAMRDGDPILAVIKSTAMTNDGADKVGYTAPSISGQATAIANAHAAANIDPETIDYIEAHGTGTSLGDPIEIAALTDAFRRKTQKRNFCAIGSVKTNVGHLDAAAGVAGLIKTVLALNAEEIPPSLNFETPNPNIDFDNSPFFVNQTLRAWPRGDKPRRAGVSSFGLGGTNVHVVLEEAPQTTSHQQPATDDPQLLVLSARSQESLDAQTSAVAGAIANATLADAAFTLAVGRRAFDHRRFAVCRDAHEAAEVLRARDPRRVITGTRSGDPRVVFLFPGGGAQYASMGAELYATEPVYRDAIDECGALIANRDDTSELPSRALPALFAVEYAMARLWRSWGLEPHALLGHSAGEYAAACIAGVFSLRDALALVALRGRLFETLAPGAMLSVPMSEEEAAPFARGGVSIAAVNHPASCVLAGPVDAIDRLERVIGVDARRIHIAVAAHSQLVEPILDEFRRFVASIERHAPRIPIYSNLTGTRLTNDEARDPEYWTRHLRETVRFANAAAELLRDPNAVFLETGPGNTLSSLVQRHPARGEQPCIASMRHPNDAQADRAFLLHAAGRLWLEGAPLDWKRVYANGARRRIALPGTAFIRKRHWIKPRVERRGVADWFYAPTWKRVTAAPLPPRQDAERIVLFDADVHELLRVARAAKERDRDVHITVITRNAQDVTGDEPLDPERATILGALKVIAQESPHIRCDAVDVDRITPDAAAGNAMFTAQRGPYRWELAYEPMRLDSPPRLKNGGTYVITGGGGGVARILVRYLREKYDARVIALTREVADVADESQLRAAFDRIGTIDGVIHAAGVTRGRSIFVPFEELTDEDIDEQFRAKVHGTRSLAGALEGRALDFVLLMSSNASILGGLGLAAYAAANQFLDAFAALMNRRGDVPWISANWDGWPSGAPSSSEFAMSLNEATDAFERVTSARGQVVVSAGDLHARLARFTQLEPEPAIAIAPEPVSEVDEHDAP
ncbi:MAG TPA: amino acid adenylation domain-containing protein, partial [Thermoanaerobaculia bacterium]|nr:amino acid adenylation domain-containing protein [Thermoanaerobaculia bacterium]